MLNYLKKFNNLPKELRDRFSSPTILAVIGKLEKKYSINLATIIIRVAIKELNINKLPQYFINQFNLDNKTAFQLSNELKKLIGAPPQFSSRSEKNWEGVNSNFFFSTDDEEEVKKISENKNNNFDDKIFNNNINFKLNNIVKQIAINSSNPVLLNRLKQILKTYILGIRNEIDIKQTLIKPVENGGLGLREELVNKILITAKNIKNTSVAETHQNINQQPNKLKNIGLRDIDYDLTMLKNKNNIQNKSNIKYKLAPPPPVISSQAVLKNKFLTQQTTPQNIKRIDNNKQSIIPEIMLRTPNNIGNKKRIEDIKYSSKIMNPVDELRYLNLINFRRLSADPYKTIEKIKNKIYLLEEEQFSKKIQGIQSWRQSPVNKLYIKMGEQCLDERQSIKSILEKRKKNNQDFLTLEEFAAIADLNKCIAY
ncbi:hypothetical protein KKG18_02175 [Patescibacteria group bacterium]|nr:hypothetical protein [Patescibacteria group bacterium]